MEFERHFSPNRYLRREADKFESADTASRINLTQSIIKTMTSSGGSSITHDTRKYIVSILGEKFTSKENTFQPYIYNGSSKGKTYLATTYTDERDDTYAALLLLHVSHKKTKKEVIIPDGHQVLVESFGRAFKVVIDVIKSINKELFVPADLFNFFSFKITDRHGREILKGISGESIELPFALAIFSVLVDRDLPASVASSGRLDGENIIAVNDIPEKMDSAFTEFEEIEKFISPIAISIKKWGDHKMHSQVSKIKEALFHCFKDYDQLIKKISFPGIVGHSIRPIRITVGGSTLEGKEIRFLISEGERVDPAYLKQFDRITGLEDEIRSGFAIINNAKASWHIGYICARFKNVITNIAIYDPKLSQNSETYKAYVVKIDDKLNVGLGINPELGDIVEYSVQESNPD